MFEQGRFKPACTYTQHNPGLITKVKSKGCDQIAQLRTMIWVLTICTCLIAPFDTTQSVMLYYQVKRASNPDNNGNYNRLRLTAYVSLQGSKQTSDLDILLLCQRGSAITHLWHGFKQYTLADLSW